MLKWQLTMRVDHGTSFQKISESILFVCAMRMPLTFDTRIVDWNYLPPDSQDLKPDTIS